VTESQAPGFRSYDINDQENLAVGYRAEGTVNVELLGYSWDIQLGIDAAGSSNFLVSADTFAVYNPTTTGQELVFAATGGQLFLRSVFIQDGSIDNAKIGNFIQSVNYVAGSAGWRLDKGGTLEMNGSAGGGQLKINADRIVFYDAANRPLVVMGKPL